MILRLCLFTYLCLITTAQAFVINYNGEALFMATTNTPGISIEGRSSTFKTLSADFSEDKLTLIKCLAVLDAETLKTGIDRRDRDMLEKIFLPLSAQEKPVLLKFSMEKTNCQKDGKNLICSGEGQFVFGKKAFNKKVQLKFDESFNTQFKFTMSLKELELKAPSFLGITLEDKVDVDVKIIRSN